jgi:hypothetical protein
VTARVLAGPSHQYEENSKNSSRGARRREAGQTQVLEPRAKALCRGEGTNLWQQLALTAKVSMFE